MESLLTKLCLFLEQSQRLKFYTMVVQTHALQNQIFGKEPFSVQLEINAPKAFFEQTPADIVLEALGLDVLKAVKNESFSILLFDVLSIVCLWGKPLNRRRSQTSESHSLD